MAMALRSAAMCRSMRARCAPSRGDHLSAVETGQPVGDFNRRAGGRFEVLMNLRLQLRKRVGRPACAQLGKRLRNQRDHSIYGERFDESFAEPVGQRRQADAVGLFQPAQFAEMLLGFRSRPFA